MRVRHCLLFTCFSAFLITFDAQGQSALAPVDTPPPVSTSPAAGTPSRIVPKYVPPTGKDRLRWVIDNTLGPLTLAAEAADAGWQTINGKPHEYNTHWEGFGERFGLDLSGTATSNAMEASIGAIWGEDPRYFRAEAGRPFKNRMGHVVRMTFLAKNAEGQYMPAYARYTAIAGSNFLSNTWRPESDATAGRATVRIGFGFAERLARNMWDEFWPDVKNGVFHH
jgi:hypothetical protein